MDFALTGRFMVTTFAHLFTPRTSNNHRPRLLHPAGLAVLVAIVLVAQSGLQLAKIAPPGGLVLGYASNISTDQVLSQTNDERSKLGLAPLRLNASLSQAAAAKANHMFANDYWAHISPDGLTPWKFIKESGYRYTVAGENLARDFDVTPNMVQAWMASATHKANIVHKQYSETGVAVVNGNLNGVETTLVVQMFGRPTQSAIAAPVQAKAEATGITSPEVVETAETGLEPAVEAGVKVQEPEVLAQVETNQEQLETEQTLVAPVDIKRSLALAVVMLVVATIAIDEVVVRHKNPIRFVGRNLAHLSFLGLALIIVLQASKAGGVL